VARYGQARSLDEWIDETKKLLDPGLFKFRENICRDDGCDYEIVRLDQQGVEALTRLLDEWSKAEDAEEIDAREWYARLKRFLESNEIALSTPHRTGVRIVEAHEAALFPFEHTFLVHANDGEFPKRPGVEPLFSDEERRVLHARGLPLAHRQLTLRRERALWRAVTANPAVTISYRTADVRGTPLLPSLLVPEHEETDAIARTQFLPDRPLNLAGSQQAAAHELAEAKSDGRKIVVAVPDPSALKAAVLNAYAETQRRGGPGREAGVLGPWNGELRDRVMLDHLEERFGPDHLWSATSLELYGKCPFLFLVEKVLFLDVRDEADPETSPLVRGGVAHDILERFYGRLRAAGSFPGGLDGKTKALLHEIAEEVFAEREASRELLGGYLGDRHFWEIAKRGLLEGLEWYVGEELERHVTAKNERPEGFEVRFGYPGEPRVTVSGHDVTDTQRSMQVIGRIDRVDIKTKKKDGAESYWILDYKLSSTPAFKGYDDGSVIQVPLYMRALEMLIANGDIELEDRPVRGGRYRSLKRGKSLGNSAVIDLNKRGCVEKYEKALRYALSIAERVRQGRFECKRANGAGDWPSYEPGLDVRRTDAQYEEGGRFDE
jgi:ATP-dependent helicase/DNAse subunit B